MLMIEKEIINCIVRNIIEEEIVGTQIIIIIITRQSFNHNPHINSTPPSSSLGTGRVCDMDIIPDYEGGVWSLSCYLCVWCVIIYLLF